MNRIVLDTNTAVSGLLSSGPGAAIFRLADAGKLSLWGCSETFDEFCEVIRYARIERKIRTQYRGVLAFEREYARLLNLISIAQILPGILVPDDRDDEMFIRAATAAQCRVIVTRDNHLLDLDPFDRIAIISPEVFMTAWRAVTRRPPNEQPRRWHIPWRR
jgi:putative PIN family toxin of toxin-antitoxin system